MLLQHEKCKSKHDNGENSGRGSNTEIYNAGRTPKNSCFLWPIGKLQAAPRNKLYESSSSCRGTVFQRLPFLKHFPFCVHQFDWSKTRRHPKISRMQDAKASIVYHLRHLPNSFVRETLDSLRRPSVAIFSIHLFAFVCTAHRTTTYRETPAILEMTAMSLLV